jgi:lipopolysaccharide export system permease protein
MSTYLDRDLIRSLFNTLLIILGFIQIGYLVSVFLQMSSYIFASESSKLGWVFLYYLATIPRQMAFTIPVTTGVSILWVFTIKARQNEILAWLSGGISPVRIARPVLILSLLLSIASYFILEYIAIPGDRYAREIEYVNIREKGADYLHRETNIFQRGKGNRFYNIWLFRPAKGEMELPIIIDMGEDWNSLDWRLESDTAVRDPNNHDDWIFHNAVFRRWNEEGELIEFLHKPTLRTSQIGVTIEGQLNEYLANGFRPSRMSRQQLATYINLYKEQGKPTSQLEAYYHFNFALPFGCFILALLMCGHILKPSSTGIMVGFGGGLIYVAAYYILVIGMHEVSKTGLIDPMLGQWSANLIFFLLGLYQINRYKAS